MTTESPDEWVTISLPMACIHGDGGEADGRSLVTEVMERLGHGTTAEDFLTAVAYSLDLDHGARIADIVCDQWAAVIVERWGDKTRVSIECDFIEHGIAAIWKAFADGAVPPRAAGSAPASGPRGKD